MVSCFRRHIPENIICNASMVTDNTTLSVIRTKGLIGLDVTSRDDLLPLKTQQVIMTSSDQLYSDNLLQTSWIGVRLDKIMSPCVGVSVSSSRAQMPHWYLIVSSLILTIAGICRIMSTLFP